MKTHRDENKQLEEEADAQGWDTRREGRRCVRGSLENRPPRGRAVSCQLWQGASNSREGTLEDYKQRNNTASGYGQSGQIQGVF